MRSRLNLKPGQKGTKRLVEKYGKALLDVRYRYDEIRGVRLSDIKEFEAVKRLRKTESDLRNNGDS